MYHEGEYLYRKKAGNEYDPLNTMLALNMAIVSDKAMEMEAANFPFSV